MTLAKIHKEHILKMINDNDNINWIVSYCKGAGLDTSKVSSPVVILDGKISITYRGERTYYYY